jgi:hypothetical protein
VPPDFKDYFLSSSNDAQQKIINSLLSLSTSVLPLEEYK